MDSWSYLLPKLIADFGSEGMIPPELIWIILNENHHEIKIDECLFFKNIRWESTYKNEHILKNSLLGVKWYLLVCRGLRDFIVRTNEVVSLFRDRNNISRIAKYTVIQGILDAFCAIMKDSSSNNITNVNELRTFCNTFVGNLIYDVITSMEELCINSFGNEPEVFADRLAASVKKVMSLVCVDEKERKSMAHSILTRVKKWQDEGYSVNHRLTTSILAKAVAMVFFGALDSRDLVLAVAGHIT